MQISEIMKVNSWDDEWYTICTFAHAMHNDVCLIERARFIFEFANIIISSNSQKIIDSEGIFYVVRWEI